MSEKFDEMLNVLGAYANAYMAGDATKAEELKGALRQSFGAAVVEVVAENYRANGRTRELLLEDPALTFHLSERTIREGRQGESA